MMHNRPLANHPTPNHSMPNGYDPNKFKYTKQYVVIVSWLNRILHEEQKQFKLFLVAMLLYHTILV